MKHLFISALLAASLTLSQTYATQFEEPTVTEDRQQEVQEKEDKPTPVHSALIDRHPRKFLAVITILGVAVCIPLIMELFWAQAELHILHVQFEALQKEIKEKKLNSTKEVSDWITKNVPKPRLFQKWLLEQLEEIKKPHRWSHPLF